MNARINELRFWSVELTVDQIRKSFISCSNVISIPTNSIPNSTIIPSLPTLAQIANPPGENLPPKKVVAEEAHTIYDQSPTLIIQYSKLNLRHDVFRFDASLTNHSYIHTDPNPNPMIVFTIVLTTLLSAFEGSCQVIIGLLLLSLR